MITLKFNGFFIPAPCGICGKTFDDMLDFTPVIYNDGTQCYDFVCMSCTKKVAPQLIPIMEQAEYLRFNYNKLSNNEAIELIDVLQKKIASEN